MDFFKNKIYKNKIVLSFLSLFSNPIDNHIIFISLRNKYSGNNKVLSDYILKNHNNFVVHWLFSHKNQVPTDLPDNVIPLVLEKIDDYMTYLNCKYVILDSTMPASLFKSKKQVCFQLWHGDRGMKKVMYDAFPDAKFYDEDFCDYAVSGSDYMDKKYVRAFKIEESKILKFGCPKNDIFFNDSPKNNIHSLFNIGDKDIILYAPTLRDCLRNEKISVPFDYKLILDSYKRIHNREAVFFVRAHSGNKQGMIINDNCDYIDVSNYPNTEDLLLETDFLITDYSSIAGDFALRNKLIVLFLPNDDYIKNERELVFDINSSPFLTAKTENDIIRHMELSSSDIENNNKEILNFYGCYEEGKACEKIMRFIQNEK